MVHGGTRFRAPVVLDDEVVRALDELGARAAHNGPALAAIAERAGRCQPFRTWPSSTRPSTRHCRTRQAPTHSRDAGARRGIRRYGFHGLSVAWAAERVAVPRLVVCHLGGGCSVTAVRDGRSVETSMGFSPLEGVPMATRSGTIDPEIVLHMIRHGLASAEEIEAALERESGLLGLSGLSARVEELEASEEPEAGLALEVFAYRVACAVAASAVALDGLDALVFTAGVGERSPGVRSAVCGRLGFLGVELDEAANAAAGRRRRGRRQKILSPRGRRARQRGRRGARAARKILGRPQRLKAEAPSGARPPRRR